MMKKRKTDAFIQSLNESTLKKFSISLPENQNITNNQFILVIKTSTEKCVRITIYPLKEKEIVKLKIVYHDAPKDFITNLFDILKNYEIVHTTGLLEIGEELNFECYLKSIEAKELKKSLDKIKNSSTLFSIEKIKIKK